MLASPFSICPNIICTIFIMALLKIGTDQMLNFYLPTRIHYVMKLPLKISIKICIIIKNISTLVTCI